MDYNYYGWKEEMHDAYDALDPENHGYVKSQDLPDFDDTQRYLHEIMGALYESGSVADIESALEDLCHQFGVAFNPRECQVVSKEVKPVDLMSWTAGYQSAVMDCHKSK